MPRHRANGEGGSFFSKAHGCWFATYTRGFNDQGRAVVKRFRGATRDEAARRRDADRDLWRQGIEMSYERETQTVQQFLLRWLDSITRAPSTARAYRMKIEANILPALGPIKLRDLREDHLLRLYRRLRATPGLAVRIHQILHAALAYAVKHRDLIRNPADFVDQPKYRSPEIHPPSVDEVRALLDYAVETNDRWACLYIILAYTGMRPNEAIGLEWRDVDWTIGELFLQRTRASDGPPVKGEIKTKQSRRVTLPPIAVEALRSHRKAQLDAIAAAGPRWTDLGLVFSTTIGTPIGWANVFKDFKATLTRAGIADYSPYAFFRHAHVTTLLAAGVPPQDVAWRTGHSLQTMWRVYAHRVMARDADAAMRLQQVLTGDNTNQPGRTGSAD